MRFVLGLLLGLLTFGVQAQPVTQPVPVGAAGAYNSSGATCTNGQFCFFQTDAKGNLQIGSTAIAPYSFTPLGPSQNALGVATATTLTIPIGAAYATVCVEGAAVRWTWDGTTTPTASVGQPMLANSCTAFSGAAILANLKFIQQAATATLDVEYAK